MRPRWAVRSLVVLTALLCLGLAGHAGQVWWARRIAQRLSEVNILSYRDRETIEKNPILSGTNNHTNESLLRYWRATPWYGALNGGFWDLPETHLWMPQRVYYERARMITGLDLPNDPSVWEAWFQAHPDLVWDERLKRLVERP